MPAEPSRTPDEQLDLLVAIARRAAAEVMRHYRHDVEVELKGPNDPVTVADRRSNELICRALQEGFPEAAVIAEESAPTQAEHLATVTRNRRVFYVDPLDGTREFIEHNGEFSVLIGLAVNHRPRLGVVALPAEQMVLAGAVGGGAYALDSQGHRRPLDVSRTDNLGRAAMLVSRSRPTDLADVLLQAGEIAAVRPCGSVGVKVARIVTAQAETYVHGAGLKRWDCCAAEALLLAAGGAMTDLHGRPLDYAGGGLTLTEGLVASNGRLHEALLAAVHRAI